MVMTALCILLQLAAVAASRDRLPPFQRLQVSSPMVVTVITDPTLHNADLDVAADSTGLGWTVQSQVQPMTFGSTLLLGMDDRATRQHFAWPDGAQMATLKLPMPLQSVSVTGGAQVLVDIVTGDLAADGKSNLTVKKFQSRANASHLFLADDANITVRSGIIGDVLVQAWHDGKVDLKGTEVSGMLNMRVDPSSSVLILPSASATPAPAVNLTNATKNVSAVSNGTAQAPNASNVTVAHITTAPSDASLVIP
ncbi:unnamed protein product [Symbiodinium natans]|uniref:Auto-transporter adhesin head GIN domain-containing protein n=1 Tax=Symbiodinium natans TaxID=878477 RepID=A0A812V2X9_9DINO|nr:unnamed protein product [Symbiodinium natans]